MLESLWHNHNIRFRGRTDRKAKLETEKKKSKRRGLSASSPASTTAAAAAHQSTHLAHHALEIHAT
jgi:hypothetical protein